MVKNKKTKNLVGEFVDVSIFCRSVGMGGTTVAFYARPNGVWAVWRNEGCPYPSDDEIKDERTYACLNLDGSPGHNISVLSWDDINKFAIAASRWAGYQPSSFISQPKMINQNDWTQEEQDLILSIACQSSDPDAVLEVGNLIVEALRLKHT